MLPLFTTKTSEKMKSVSMSLLSVETFYYVGLLAFVRHGHGVIDVEFRPRRPARGC